MTHHPLVLPHNDDSPFFEQTAINLRPQQSRGRGAYCRKFRVSTIRPRKSCRNATARGKVHEAARPQPRHVDKRHATAVSGFEARSPSVATTPESAAKAPQRKQVRHHSRRPIARVVPNDEGERSNADSMMLLLWDLMAYQKPRGPLARRPAMRHGNLGRAPCKSPKPGPHRGAPQSPNIHREASFL